MTQHLLMLLIIIAAAVAACHAEAWIWRHWR
jgi:hypothetical protein